MQQETDLIYEEEERKLHREDAAPDDQSLASIEVGDMAQREDIGPTNPNGQPQEEMERDEAIMAIAASVLTKRQEAVMYRAASGIESFWRACEQMLDYSADMEGVPTLMDYVQGKVPVTNKGPHRSQVVMNITRGRCEVAAGRFEDILFPVREKNWAFKTTPLVETADMVGDMRQAAQNGAPIQKSDGTTATLDDIAADLQTKAEKAMVGMERKISDYLSECKHSAECRKMIKTSVGLGTGVLKGPTVTKKLRKIWSQKKDKSGRIARVLQYIEENKPGSSSVSPWNCYPSPDCGDNVARCTYMWEKDTMRPRDVRRLIGVKGYNERQLELVLQESPTRLNIANDQHGDVYHVEKQALERGEMYEVWEYTGEIDTGDLSTLMGRDATTEGPVSAKIIFINDHPVKASFNLLDTGDLGYVFFPWDEIPDSPWGAGEPLKVMWAQRIINGAWRAMMDNAGDSSGVNLAILGLVPDDNSWEITGKKLWKYDGTTQIDDIRKAITQFQATNNQVPLQNILELALRFIDLMTATPTIFQGESKEAPDTLGATNIVVDSSNITYRSKVKRWDDMVTIPHLQMYYDWEMQFGKDDSIKVDLNVEPIGASVLFEKDQQRQALIQTFQLRADPTFMERTDWDKAVEQFFANSHLDILKPKKKVQPGQEEQQPPAPPDPTIEAAKIRVQGDLEKVKMNHELEMKRLDSMAKEAELERAHKTTMKQYDMKIKMMEYAEKKNITIMELKTQLALGSASLQQSEKSERRAEAKAISQVAEPPVEPPQHAPNGQAYQQ
jgi:hypothetical protein